VLTVEGQHARKLIGDRWDFLGDELTYRRVNSVETTDTTLNIRCAIIKLLKTNLRTIAVSASEMISALHSQRW
jgi:hypothetical protein